MEVRRFLANQIKLNKTRLHVIRCDDSEDSSDSPQFEMNVEMGDDEQMMGDDEQSDDEQMMGDDEQSDDDDDDEDKMLDDDDEDEMRVDEEAYQIDQTLNLTNTQSMEQVKFIFIQ